MGEAARLSERKSAEGLTALLGAYASEEEEDDQMDIEQHTEAQNKLIGETPQNTVREVVQATDSTTGLEKPTRDLDLEDPVSITESGIQQGLNTGPEIEASIAEGPNKAQSIDNFIESNPFWLQPEIAEEPPGPCPADRQNKVNDLLEKQQKFKKTISSSLKQVHGYKNPEFLAHCVTYDGVTEYASCYPRNIFDPYGLPEEDRYDRLAAEFNLSQEKIRQERAARTFQSAGTEKQKMPQAAVSQPKKASSKTGSKSSKWDTKR